MNINNTATASAPVVAMPVETPMPVSSPVEVVAAENIKNQLSDDNRQAARAKNDQKNNFSADEAKQVASEMNEIMDDLHTDLGFSIREDLDHLVIVEIKNRQTNELVKQIPSEEMLAIKEKMEELTGLLLDQSV
jgi:flagellar protein FlaG